MPRVVAAMLCGTLIWVYPKTRIILEGPDSSTETG